MPSQKFDIPPIFQAGDTKLPLVRMIFWANQFVKKIRGVYQIYSPEKLCISIRISFENCRWLEDKPFLSEKTLASFSGFGTRSTTSMVTKCVSRGVLAVIFLGIDFRSPNPNPPHPSKCHGFLREMAGLRGY